MHPRSLRRRAAASLVLAFVLALHAAAWWIVRLPSPAAQRPHTSAPARITLRWLPPAREAAPEPPTREAAPEPPRPGAAKAPAPAARRAPQARAAATRPPAPVTSTPAPSAGAPVAPPPAPEGVPPAATAGTADAPLSGLLDSPATRRAIADAARAPSLAQLPGTTQRAGPSQRLGDAIGAGAHGDCDKGQYVGGGMGLLSLPFLAVAKLRGDCAR